LIGAHQEDHVGGCNAGDYCPHVTGLPRGGYLVSSPSWDDDDNADVGAETFVEGGGALSAVVSPRNSLIGSAAQELFGNDYSIVFTDGMVVSRAFTPDLGIGIVVPRRAGGSVIGVVGNDANDVRGSSHAGGSRMTFDYDARRGLLLASDPGANFVTLRTIASAAVRGHSRHARRPRLKPLPTF
jgi:hypothetical protein